MFDYDLLEKCCVYKNNTLTWFTEEIHPVVYMLKIGEDNYIGSTWNIKNRINGYIATLPNGKYNAKSVQEAYNKSDAFICFIVERIVVGDIRVREQFYINLINPTLNTLKETSITKSDLMENHIQNGYFQLRTDECFKQHNIRPKEVADKLGISAYSFNKMMQFPSHDFLYKVARTMNIPFIDFFTNEPYYRQGVFWELDGKIYKATPK